MRTFTLSSPEGVLHLEGELPAIAAPYFAWDYKAKLKGHSLEAEISVGDDNPQEFVEFFSSLERDWKGWVGGRAYGSLDKTLEIVASHDGHRSVVLVVSLKADARTMFDWQATQRFTLEPGQLSDIAMAARRYAT